MTAQEQHLPKELTKAAAGVVFLCFFTHMLARGLSETIAVFLLPVTQDMQWSRTEFSSIYAIFMATHAVTAPIVGALFDRFGPKYVYLGATLSLAAGYALASEMTQLWHAQLGLGVLIGIAVSGMGMAIATGLISRWFSKNMTLATSFAYAGMSVGMIAVAPLSQILIDLYGWRNAYQILGMAPLIFAPILLLLPWSRITSGRTNSKQITPRRLLIPAQILRQPTFWGLFVSFYATSVAIWSTALQTVAYLIEIGFSPITAATAFGSVGAMSMIGMVSTGFLADKYGRRPVITISFLITMAGVALIWRLNNPGEVIMLFTAVMTFGVTMGSRGPVISSLVAKLYPSMVGAVYGTITIAFGLGAATGGLLSGFLHDVTGGYDAVFISSLIACVIGLTPYWIFTPLRDAAWPKGKEPKYESL